MRLIVTIAVFVLAASPAGADPDAGRQALEVLANANAAAASLTAISYDGKYLGAGGAADVIREVSGKIRARRGPDDRHHRVRIDGSAPGRGSSPPVRFTLAIDGTHIYTIDHRTKVFSDGIIDDAAVVASHPLFQPRYLHASPYEQEINGKSARYLGLLELDGVTCDVLNVEGQGNAGRDARLFFGQKDHLLRRIEMNVQLSAPGGGTTAAGQVVFTASNVNVNPSLDDDIFRLERPADFENKPMQMSSRQQQAPPGLLPAGSEAPDWELKTFEGKTVSLKSLRGKVVLLDFWATWCGPCQMAMPGLQRLHDRFKDKPVAIYGINCLERSPSADPKGLIKKKGFTYGQLQNGNAAARAYRVGGLPCLYLLGVDGKILTIKQGFHPRMEAELARIIEDALKTRP